MRRRVRSRAGATTAFVAACFALTQAFAGSLIKAKPAPPKVKETVGDLAYFYQMQDIAVQGVGLVIGLNKTGGDPPPGVYRDQLLEQMRKANVEGAEKLLKDPGVTAVVVKAKIPIGATFKDRIDLHVEPIPGSTATSLAGGQLLEARLSEMVRGGDNQVHVGAHWVVGGGPVLTGDEADPNNLKVGKVLGGGKIKREFPYTLVIKENRRSIKTSAILMSVINQRFHRAEGVNEQGMVTAKDVKAPDKYLNVKIPSVYHLNETRFFQVVKLLPIATSADLEKQRIEECRKLLLEPKTSAKAALRLEGFGQNAVVVLKEGLKSESRQVKFFSAEALAYLNDASGTEILAENVIKDAKFRVFALAALAAMDQPPAYMALRKLMSEPDLSVRYGAFDALRTIDAQDPSLGRVQVIDAPNRRLDDDRADDMALHYSKAVQKKGRYFRDPFEFYVVDSDGPPLIHVSTIRRCEIVIFGMNQKMLTPMTLSDGAGLMVNASDGDSTVQVSRITPNSVDNPNTKATVSLEIDGVIKTMARMGASYPEIITVLLKGQDGRNLPGPLAIDGGPGPNEAYFRAVYLGEDATAKKDSGLKRTSGEDGGIGGWFTKVRKKIRGED